MELTGAEIVVEGLKSAGVTVAFGVSGSSLLPILDVLHRTPEIRYVQAQHEQFATFMANGYARQALRPGICLVSPGPGESNTLTGVAQAHYTSTPTIVIAAEESSHVLGMGASIHHDLDAPEIFRSVTKLSLRVERADRLQQSLQRALTAAMSGRKGPCFVGIPEDFLDARVNVESPALRLPPFQPASGNPSDIEAVAALLEHSSRPLILAGGGVNWAGAHDEVRQLAERYGIPVGGTRGHNGFLPVDHPLGLGTVSPGCFPPSLDTLRDADLIIGIGCTFAYFFGGGVRMPVPKDAKIIHIDIDPGEIGKVLPAHAAVVGDAKLVVQDLMKVLEERGVAKPVKANETDWTRLLAQRKSSWDRQIAPLQASTRVPIQNFRLMADLRAALPRNAVVAADSGGTRQWFDRAFPSLAPNTIGGWHPMGAELCEAMGVKVASPEIPVCVLMGDGSAMMSLQEWATAAANDIPILCGVLHNGVFGNMHHSQITKFGSRFIGTDVPIPNLANVARELGAYGERVEEPADIIPAVKRALESGRPALLEFMVDSSAENLVPPRISE